MNATRFARLEKRSSIVVTARHFKIFDRISEYGQEPGPQYWCSSILVSPFVEMSALRGLARAGSFQRRPLEAGRFSLLCVSLCAEPAGRSAPYLVVFHLMVA